jgi:hypothetical protein
MNILSIDVGMKNLAFCIINYKGSLDNYEIKEWDVLNLCETEHNKTCMGISKQNKICDKASKYFKHDKYYCKLHTKNKHFLIPTTDKTKLTKMKMIDLKTITTNRNIDLSGNYKKKDIIECVLNDLSENYFEPIQKTDSRHVSFITYGKHIKHHFNNLNKKIPIDCVLIENQIGPIAIRMKLLQGMIMQHFIENGCENIKEISPINKLKEFLNKKKTTYAERKKLGIDVCKKIINDTDTLKHWVGHFNKHKKKDDLADSFLQVLWYIKQL